MGANLFGVLGGDRLPWAQALAITILLLVITGWRPRFTGVLHAWVSLSYSTAAFMPEGGDQLAANLALLLVPVTLADPRRSHWKYVPVLGLSGRIAALVAASALFVIRLQVAGVYLHAAIGKMDAREWANGTAVYYWWTKPVFGAPDWLAGITNFMIESPLGVSVLTWGTIGLELLLFAALVMSPEKRKLLLVVGVAFHFVIVLVHGLAAFFLSMTGALILYLWPTDQPLPSISLILTRMGHHIRLPRREGEDQEPRLAYLSRIRLTVAQRRRRIRSIAPLVD